MKMTESMVGCTGLLIAIVVFAFGLVPWPSTAQSASSNSKGDATTAEAVIIPVEGMTCSACVARVKRALKSVKGVSDVRVSLEKREAEVRYEPKKTSPEKLAKSINDLGYKAGTPKRKEKAQ